MGGGGLANVLKYGEAKWFLARPSLNERWPDQNSVFLFVPANLWQALRDFQIWPKGYRYTQVWKVTIENLKEDIDIIAMHVRYKERWKV